jgi:hypothetical protein
VVLVMASSTISRTEGHFPSAPSKRRSALAQTRWP